MANGLVTDVAGAVQRGLQFRQAEALRPIEQQRAQLGLQQQQQQFEQAQALQPLGLQQAELGIQRQQQQFETGGLQQQALQQQIDVRTDEQKDLAFGKTALTVDTLSDAQLPSFFQENIARVEAQGGDATESRKALALIEAGDIGIVRESAKNVVGALVKQGVFKADPTVKKAPFQRGDKGLVFNPNTGTFSVDPIAAKRIDDLAVKAKGQGSLGFKDRKSLNKDVTNMIKEAVQVRDTADDLKKLGKVNSGPAAIAIVFKFMKALDPTSVVREGEFALAERSAGVPESVLNIYNKLVTGERLGDLQIQQFTEAARVLSNSAAESALSQVTSLLDTFEDTIPDSFKSKLIGRIPKAFEVSEQPPASIAAPALAPAAAQAGDDLSQAESAELAELELKFGGQ